MLRAIRSGLFTLLITLFTYLILPLLLVIIAVLILIGMGSLLARFLPLTTFEATLIVTLVALPTVWAYWQQTSRADPWTDTVDALDEIEEEQELARNIVHVPNPRVSSGRKRNKRG